MRRSNHVVFLNPETMIYGTASAMPLTLCVCAATPRYATKMRRAATAIFCYARCLAKNVFQILICWFLLPEPDRKSCRAARAHNPKCSPRVCPHLSYDTPLRRHVHRPFMASAACAAVRLRSVVAACVLAKQRRHFTLSRVAIEVRAIYALIWHCKTLLCATEDENVDAICRMSHARYSAHIYVQPERRKTPRAGANIFRHDAQSARSREPRAQRGSERMRACRPAGVKRVRGDAVSSAIAWSTSAAQIQRGGCPRRAIEAILSVFVTQFPACDADAATPAQTEARCALIYAKTPPRALSLSATRRRKQFDNRQPRNAFC